MPNKVASAADNLMSTEIQVSGQYITSLML